MGLKGELGGGFPQPKPALIITVRRMHNINVPCFPLFKLSCFIVLLSINTDNYSFLSSLIGMPPTSLVYDPNSSIYSPLIPHGNTHILTFSPF